MIATSFTSGAGVYNGNQYTVSLTLSRANQDAKRADLHETEKLRITMDPDEATRLAEALLYHAQSLHYYEQFGTWPDFNKPASAWKTK
jgi:hypothetical protein